MVRRYQFREGLPGIMGWGGGTLCVSSILSDVHSGSKYCFSICTFQGLESGFRNASSL